MTTSPDAALELAKLLLNPGGILTAAVTAFVGYRRSAGTAKPIEGTVLSATEPTVTSDHASIASPIAHDVAKSRCPPWIKGGHYGCGLTSEASPSRACPQPCN